jgi:hypothetical protein
MKKEQNIVRQYIYWLLKYIQAILFPRLGLEKGFRRDWMSWRQFRKLRMGKYDESIINNTVEENI